jgi:hypothetical protein
MVLDKSFRDQATRDSLFRRMALDDLLRRAAERHRDAIALIHPPDRTLHARRGETVDLRS